ncbi:hypothetical protein D1AOALGA4SA_6171 [Olavius algarvensis Delta 1 endosymbiont]|nr:hypothetical protein D1AOALGA4SA_6171 [Olavius algarvensis Delta 1 endosymbiont]
MTDPTLTLKCSSIRVRPLVKKAAGLIKEKKLMNVEPTGGGL